MKKLDKKILRKNIEKAAMYDLEENNIFGTAYAVYQDGEELFKGCFGVTSPDGEDVREDTIFRLASMTKPITAVAALILIERGLISLDDPVTKYIPEFEGIHITEVNEKNELIDKGEAKNIIYIRNLLSHTSGIGTLVLDGFMTDEDRRTIENMISFYARTGIGFEPMSQQQYSGVGAFDVMTAIIERVTGEDYLTFLKREIFMPCNMSDTTFMPDESRRKRMITMHNKVDGKNAVGETFEGCVFQNFPMTHFLGGAGLVSTLNDYIKFALMLQNKGVSEGGRIVSEDTFALLTQINVTDEIMPGNEKWGLGVRVITDSSYPSLDVGTYGWSGAYGTHFWIDPENKVTAVFMKNSRFDGGAANKSAVRFEEAVYASFEM